MTSVDCIDTIEHFHQLEKNWHEVYSNDDDADYFLSWSWLSQLYKCCDEGVFILAVKNSNDASRYCAFLPLKREVRFSASKGRFFNCLSMAGSHWADSTGLICDSDVERQVIPVLAQALKTLSWQRLFFGSFKISPYRKTLLMQPFPSQNYAISDKKPGSDHDKADLSRSPFVELPQTFECYLKDKANSDTAQRIKEVRRAMEDDMSLSIVLADCDTLDQYLTHPELQWEKSNTSIGGASAPHCLSPYPDFIRLGVRSGEMLVPVLLRDSRPMGFFACYKDEIKKQLHFFAAASTSDFDRFSGGLALHVFCIEWAIERKFARYHLLKGDEPHKYLLGASDGLRRDIVVYKRQPAPSSQLLHPELKGQALIFLAKEIKGISVSKIHQLFSQLLESWPNDKAVLSRYAEWLSSVGQINHANDIKRFLAEPLQQAENLKPFNSEIKSIDVEPYIKMQQWLYDLSREVQSLEVLGSVNVKGLQLDVASSDAAYYAWLKSYLYPLVGGDDECDGNSEGAENGTSMGSEQLHSEPLMYRLICISNNELVVSLMRLAGSGALEVNSLKIGGRRIDRIHLSTELIIDICRPDGVVWITDNAGRQLTLLMSSRTMWPSLEVSRTARVLIIAYLQQEGWLFLHSGAIRVENRNYLVIGDEGQGKTSLLLALMSGGCEYISNERVFVRKIAGTIEALSFPMPVAIGMGTAQQYPEIMQYVYNPEFCSYPNRRMNISLLRSTPESEWSSLSDKVQLLVSELAALPRHPRALQGGSISGVIVPSVDRSGSVGYHDTVSVLAQTDVRKIVSRNLIPIKNDSLYPAWLPLEFDTLPAGTSSDLIETICELPSVQFQYFASKERRQDVLEYSSILHAALSGKGASQA